MDDSGQRIEFTDPGPYVFPVLDREPEAVFLEERGVVVVGFGALYFPMTLDGARAVVSALLNLGAVESPPGEGDACTALEFDPNAVTETPLLTGSADRAGQHDDLIYLGVEFGAVRALLRLSILAAGQLGHLLSQLPGMTGGA